MVNTELEFYNIRNHNIVQRQLDHLIQSGSQLQRASWSEKTHSIRLRRRRGVLHTFQNKGSDKRLKYMCLIVVNVQPGRRSQLQPAVLRNGVCVLGMSLRGNR